VVLFNLFFVIAFAACVGSFLNVVIYRLPRGESLVFPSSHCPSCGYAIKWYDNIPLVSWLLLKGRCRQCRGPISPRYLIIEAATAGLAGGLYLCFYVLHIRDNAGQFGESWITFIAYAALLAGLLACAVIDIEHWIVPLEVCWGVSAIGILAATVSPPASQFMPRVSAGLGAAAIGAIVGLAIALVLQRMGRLQQSFIDADDKPVTSGESTDGDRPISVAITKAHGVNPRVEILREVLFLAPAIGLAVGAYLLATRVSAIGDAWNYLSTNRSGWRFAENLAGFEAALFGYLIGGAWIWGMRILGTLAFGKEAMGLGDMHILAAVGAVCGWIVPSIVFFAAPVVALLWALHLLVTHKQRELPYGPWLAAAALVVILFYDGIMKLLGPSFARFGL